MDCIISASLGAVLCHTMCAKSLSEVPLFVTPWTVAHQALLSMVFSKRQYRNGLLFPTPGDLPDPGIKPESLISPELTGKFFTTSTTWEVLGHLLKIALFIPL